MTSLVVRGDNKALAERTVLLVEYDAQALSLGVDPSIAAKWAYDLGANGGQGVGVRGTEEGMRLLASHGEIIRVDDCKLEYQDEREAFFVATASRYVMAPDGTEVKLDSQRRGKRVPKWDKRADGQGEYFVKAWYELGIVKASRNAALALMPSNVKSALLKAGLDAAAELKHPTTTQSQPRRTQQRQPDAVEGESRVVDPQPKSAGPANSSQMTAFWIQAKASGLNTDSVIAASQQLYANREPINLTPEERAALLKAMTSAAKDADRAAQDEAPPDEAPSVPIHAADHPIDPKFDERGIYQCGVCGLELDEETSLPKAIPAAQAALI